MDQLLIFIVTAKPPPWFCFLYIYFYCSIISKKALQVIYISLGRAFNYHYKQIVCCSRMKMVLFHERHHLAQVTKSKYHTYRRKQHCQLKCNWYKCGQSKVRFTTDILWPVRCKNP